MAAFPLLPSQSPVCDATRVGRIPSFYDAVVGPIRCLHLGPTAGLRTRAFAVTLGVSSNGCLAADRSACNLDTHTTYSLRNSSPSSVQRRVVGRGAHRTELWATRRAGQRGAAPGVLDEMPRVSVPLCHDEQTWRRSHSEHPASDNLKPSVSISYRVVGDGPVLVVLIPGMLVPRTMYDALSEFLVSTAQPSRFTVVAIDNRGIGESDVPDCPGFWTGPTAAGYSTHSFARDAWCVVDDVRRTRASNPDAVPLQLEVALVGHSMGGMIAQRMVLQRPREVRFAALLSTHSGGFWNFVPTTTLLLAVLRLAINRFDARVTALVNLELHFMKAFLDQHIPPAPAILESLQTRTRNYLSQLRDSYLKLYPNVAPHVPSRIDLTEAGLVKRRRRRDVYFARYIGADFDWLPDLHEVLPTMPLPLNKQPGPATVPQQSSKAPPISVVQNGRKSAQDPDADTLRTETNTTHEISGDGDNPVATKGHAIVAMGHHLTHAEAQQIARCSRLRVVVLAGADDRVITSMASRALARKLAARAFIEIPGAHFIFDEQAAQVHHMILLGLNAAFFPDQPAAHAYTDEPCDCEWCIAPPPRLPLMLTPRQTNGTRPATASQAQRAASEAGTTHRWRRRHRSDSS